MNTRMAHAFLNAVKAGYPASQASILRALRVTGDLDGRTRQKAELPTFNITTKVDRWGHTESKTEVVA